MSSEERPVRLKRPTDFLILECLLETGQNVGVNIALEIDKNRSYVNTRLPDLDDYGLIEKVGPAKRSGLYRITPLGEAALKHRDRYDDDEIDFEELIESEVESQQDCEDNEWTASA